MSDFRNRKTPAGEQQIGKSKQREQLCGVLGQAAVARLAMLKQILDDMKWMLHIPRTLALRISNFSRMDPQFIFRQRPAFGAAHRNMPGHRLAMVLCPLLDTLIRRAAMEQRMGLRHVSDVASRTNDGVHKTRRSIYPDVGLHAKVPVITFLRLMHFRIACLVTVLRRWWRSNQRGVNDCAFAHQQAFGGKMGIDRVEYLACQVVGFQQSAKFQQRRRIRRRFTVQIDSDKTADGLAVVDRIFNTFTKHCCATYIRNIRASAIGGRPAPSAFG